MKIGYFIPSYKRPQKSISQIMYPFFKLVVRESDAEEYIKNGNDIVVCPDSAQGNIARIRNYIIDNLMKDYDAIVMIDDDCSYIGYWQNQKYIKMDAEELSEFIESMSVLTKEFNYKAFGLNCLTDKGAYREHTPFSTNSFIGAPFMLIMKDNECRFDEEVSLKEDYDFTLQNLLKYKGVLRANFASYKVKQSEQEGGCAHQRNTQEEQKQFNRLQKKWGQKIIQKDPGSKKEFDFNPILKSPIKGV